jgi:predicted DNA-binding WGR domain protein
MRVALLLRPAARAAAVLAKAEPAERFPVEGESIEFLSDHLTDKGPATGEVIGVKTTVDGLYVTVKFADGQQMFSWDDLDAAGADVRGHVWMVKSHPALFPGPVSRDQAEAGNFKKRRIAWRGLTLRVENEAGTIREGHGWQTRMLFPYGEVEDTVGLDGDRVDVYIGPNLEDAPLVFVVHQRKYGRWDEHDEDKVMLGFLSEEEAATVYLKHYDDPRFLGPITTMPVEEFVARCRGDEEVTRLGKSWFGDADLLKATMKKLITVPGYYKADGTYVPPHTKMVHFNPDHGIGNIAAGGVSHSQKLAHKKLAQESWFQKLEGSGKAKHVLALATDIQDAASASAAVSGWKLAALAGKNPTLAQWKGFYAQSKDKQAALLDQIKAGAGTLQHLKAPSVPVDEKKAAEHADSNTPPPDEIDTAVDDHVESKPVGKTGPELAAKNESAAAALSQIEKAGSFYQKEALKKLKADASFENMSAHEQHEAVLDLYKQLQGAASQAAAVSMWKKAMLAGKVPSPAQHAAMVALASSNNAKYMEVYKSVVDAIGAAKAKELTDAASGKSNVAAPPKVLTDANAQQPATSSVPVQQPQAPAHASMATIPFATTAVNGFGLSLSSKDIAAAEKMLQADNLAGVEMLAQSLPAIKKKTKAALEAMIKKYQLLKDAPYDFAHQAGTLFDLTLGGTEVSQELWEKFKKQPENFKLKMFGSTLMAASSVKPETFKFIQQQFKGKGGLATDQALGAVAAPVRAPKPTPAPVAAPAVVSVGVVASVLHHTDDGHNKEWAVSTKGNQLITTYGPIGKTQQQTVKTFGSPNEALQEKAKLIKEKVAKGYHYAHSELVMHQHAVPVAEDKPPVPLNAEQEAMVIDYLKNGKGSAALEQFAMNLPKPQLEELKAKAKADVGPKDGDTKQGADGMLVFKDGHWHKVGPEPKSNATLGHDEIKAAVSGLTQPNAKFMPYVDAAKNLAVAGKLSALSDHLAKTATLKGAANTLRNVAYLHTALAIKQGAVVKKIPKAKAASIVKRALLALGGPPGPMSPANKVIGTAKMMANAGDLIGLQKLKHPNYGDKVAAAIDALVVALGGETVGAPPNMANVSKVAGVKQPEAPAPKTPQEPPAYTSAATPAFAPSQHKPGEPQPMDGWKKVGEQKGSNAGGEFQDKNGLNWYCKFPGSEDVARNEFLAAKFYQMLGANVPFLKLVTKGGKLGIASKMIGGLKKADAATLAKAPGAHESFIFDAWLGNWDVVGMSNDNLLLDGKGNAVRVDVGGSLVYRAQGGKKADFGDSVAELDTMLDPAKNPKAAPVFKGASKASLDKAIAQLNKLKPSQIEELCEKIGPGGVADRKKLAATLIARRAFILKKFDVQDQWGAVKALDPTKLPVKASDLPKPIDFVNYNGPGKGLSSKAWLNEQNTKDSAALIAFAAKGDLVALKSYQYEAIDKESGKVTGKKSITSHPSSKVQEQWAELVELLQSIATPSIPTLDMPSMGAVGALEEISDFVGSFAPTERVETVSTEHRMHFFMVLGTIDDIGSLVSGMKWVFQPVGGAWSQKMKSLYSSFGSVMKKYISSVQSTGWVNHVWSQGKKEANGTPIHKLTAEIYKDSVEVPEGTTLLRWMGDTSAGKSMSQQLLSAKPGTVLQNTDSMCASYNESHSWGGDVKVVIRCAKGVRATPSFSTGNYGGEHEVTTLPGQRYVLLSSKKQASGKGVEVELLALPPHEGFVAQVSQLAAMGKAFFSGALQSFVALLRKVAA